MLSDFTGADRVYIACGYTDLRRGIDGLAAMVQEALRLSRHKQFGSSSEKISEDAEEQLSFLFNEAEVYADAEKPEDDAETAVSAHKRHKKHKYGLDNIPEGIPLSRQTMSNWILKASQVYLEPVYEQLHKELLKRDVLHADGYAGYHNLPEKITVVGCWAHLCMKSLSKGKAKNSSAAQGVAYCTLLFEIEKSLVDEAPTERHKQRLKQVKPVLDAFQA